MVAADGGIFSFGSAPFFGSLGGVPLQHPIVAAAATYGGNGYWFTDIAGLVSNFGVADYDGSAPSPLNRPIVGMAVAPGNGSFQGDTYPSGAFGFDVSVYQCGDLPSGDHQIGIVQVDGASSAATNPCLAQEAAWAGGGLNLYTFLTYGTSATPEPGCNGDQACNDGYAAGIHAFRDAAGRRRGHGGHVVARRGGRRPLVGEPRLEPGFRAGRAQRAARIRRGAERRDLRQPRRLEQHRRRLRARRSLLDGRLPPTAERTGDVRRLRALGGASQRLPSGPLVVVQYGSAQFDEDYAC